MTLPDRDGGSPRYHYLEPLRRGKGFIAVFLLSAILSSLAITSIVSEKYEGYTVIYYRPTAASLLRTREAASFGAPMPVPPFKVISQTLLDLVKSDVILEPVVKELHLNWKEDLRYESWYGKLFHSVKEFAKDSVGKAWSILQYGRIVKESDTERAITGLRDNINIISRRESYLYLMTVKDKNPEKVAMILDLAGQKLVGWLKDQGQRQAHERETALKYQMAAKEKEIEALRTEKATMLKESHVASIPDETTKGVEKLYELELDKIRSDSQIKEKQKRVEEFNKAIDGKIQRFAQPEDLKKMRSGTLFEDIDLKGMKQRSEHLNTKIVSLKSRLIEMPDLQRKIEDLDLRIRAATQEYQQLKDFHVEVVQQLMTEQNEVKIFHPAFIYSKPVQPIRIYHVGLTALLGLIFSISFAYLIDYVVAGSSTNGAGSGESSRPGNGRSAREGASNGV